MTGIPYDEFNSLISLKSDLTYQVSDGSCCDWRCVLSPAQADQCERDDWDEFKGEFESRWQSGFHYYKASNFHTPPYGVIQIWLS